jgi:transcriptional regulator with XRE-family HTH domain
MSKTAQTYSFKIKDTLQTLGGNIKVARMQRKIPIAELAIRTGVSEGTIINIEKGKPGCTIGNIAKVLSVLGEVGQLTHILDRSSNDPVGEFLGVEALPKRIHKIKKRARGKVTHKSKSVQGSISL